MVALLTLLACTGSDSDPEPSASSSPSIALATSVPSLDSYCEIQILRKMIADGEVKASALPTFTDKTEVNGTPRILDFTKKPTESSAAFRDRLFAAPGLKSVRIPQTEVMTCMEKTTDADVEKSQGGPGHLAP